MVRNCWTAFLKGGEYGLGEYGLLLERVQAVCGFDVSVREMADELKKESCRAMKNSTTPTTLCMNAESCREPSQA